MLIQSKNEKIRAARDDDLIKAQTRLFLNSVLMNKCMSIGIDV